MNLKKIGKLLTSKSVGTAPSSYKKRIYRAAVSQTLRNTGLDYELRNGVYEFYDVGVFPRSTECSLLRNVQTGSTTHPANCSMVTGNFPRVMRMAILVNHSPPSSAEVKNEWSYTSTPPYTFIAWTGKNLPLPVGRICNRE